MLKPLTSFRFIAAFFVFLWHVDILKEFQLGYLGVSFFFMLSGFILAYTYQNKMKVLDNSEIKKFYLARFAKIYPTHLLTFVLSIPIILVTFNGSQEYLLFSAITNLFLIQSYFPSANPFGFNGVAWSISVEFFFYFLFPFLTFIILKYFNKYNRLIPFTFVLWLGLLILFSFEKTAELDSWFFYIFPLIRTFDFFTGIVLGLIFSQKNKIVFNYTLLEIFSLSLLIGSIWLSPIFPQSIRFSLIYTPFIGLLIFVFAYQSGKISKLLSNKVNVFLGEISFSFYMIHFIVLHYLHLVVSKSYFTSLVALLITLLFSYLLYVYYEEPVRKKIRYGFGQSRSQSSSVIK